MNDEIGSLRLVFLTGVSWQHRAEFKSQKSLEFPSGDTVVWVSGEGLICLPAVALEGGRGRCPSVEVRIPSSVSHLVNIQR